VHGGGWIVGHKRQQGMPLVNYMAARGWVCVSANYRLSPRATFPDHLIDLKRALAWTREHIAEYGGDPDFIVVTGGSAGGHLCSLLALTANDPRYQPGFEHVDTRTQGCVPFYGVYDFRDRHGVHRHRGLALLVNRLVMKATPESNPEAFEEASPIARIHADAPPFFIVHGDQDSMAPHEEARVFVKVLREVSRAKVVYVELPGVQHAFEVFHSIRTGHATAAVFRFLSMVHAQYLSRRAQGAEDADRSVHSTGHLDERAASGAGR
jgi:acetyl esterase/lipase